MFNLQDGTLNQGGRNESIVRWEVWFMGPNGFHPNLQHAKENGIEDCGMLIPVPVAIGETIKEAVFNLRSA